VITPPRRRPPQHGADGQHVDDDGDGHLSEPGPDVGERGQQPDREGHGARRAESPFVAQEGEGVRGVRAQESGEAADEVAR
jgi:hypothetical protein